MEHNSVNGLGALPCAKKSSRHKSKRRSAISSDVRIEDDAEMSDSDSKRKVSFVESPTKLKLKFVVQSNKSETREERSKKDHFQEKISCPSKLKLKFSLPNKSVAISEQKTDAASISPPKYSEPFNSDVEKSPPRNSTADDLTMEYNTPRANENVDINEKRKSSKVNEYISDRASRVRSYFRRRHAPFKRNFDLDLQCGTRSLLVQVCDDIEECLYFGDDGLVQKFLSIEGIKLSHVSELIAEGKKKRKSRIEDLEKDASNYRSQMNVMAGEDSGDDDYTPTVKEKEKIEKEKRKEMQQKLQDCEYLANINDRSRVFSSRKDSLISKIKETDSVCGTRSFLLIINLDQEAACFHGDPGLSSQFFRSGLSKNNLGKSFNVRLFEIEEIDQNKCSVPHCLVTRNLLSRWRLAAIQMFKFPDDLPMTLYLCPEAEKDRWISVLGLDPFMCGKIVVCSFHFKEGRPTTSNPYPSELLSPKDSEISEFAGTRPEKTSTEETIGKNSQIEKVFYKQLIVKRIHKRKKRTLKKISPTIRRQNAIAWLLKCKKWVPSSLKVNKFCELSKRSTLRRFGMRCKFCSKTFVGTRKYFEHVRQEHIKTRTATTEVQDVEPTIDSQPENDMDNAKPTVKQFKKLKIKLGPTELQPYLEIFYPNCINNAMNPKKKYVCASCKLNFNLLGLYDHMKKIHNGLLCQFCLKLFKTFSEIEKHLRVVHKVPKWYFHNPKMFLSYAGHNYDFVCSVCSESLSGKEIESHRCNKVGPKVFECPNCGETFSNQRRLEVHMSNGWCKLGGKKPGLGLGFERLDDEKECATRFKVLSGQEPNFLLLPPPKPAKPAAPKEEAPKKFSVADRQILNKFSQASKQKTCDSPEFQVLKDLPETGNIFCGKRAPGVNSKIRKEIKESGYNWKFSDAAEIFRAGVSFFLDSKLGPSSSRPSTEDESSDTDFGRKTGRDDTMSDDDIHPGEDAVPSRATESELTATDVDVTQEEKISAKFQGQNVSLKITLPPKKESKSDRIARQKIEIRESLEKIREVIESNEGCLFCQQSRVVTVDAIFLLSHLIIVHDRENVEKILGESAEATILRMRMNIKDTRKDEIIFRYKRFDSDEVSSSYSCCYCSLVINDYEDLFSHLDSAHGSKVLNCHLCQNIFLNYGSFVSHVCFGPMQQQLTAGKPRAKFVCPACDRDSLKTFLEFQFHVRKHHNICEICLMPSESQATLFQHCLTHNQELMCMKCFLTFDTLDQFRKHLFYQHEAEHTLCKECHQKSWPHVYHFCVRPDSVTCEVCDKKFHNIGQYRVHMRTHTKTNPYSCSVRSCHKSYISKQLLLKHQVRRHPDLRATASKALEERRNHRLLSKFGAKDLHSIQMAELIIDDLVRLAVAHSEEQPDQEEPEKMGDPENNTKPETSTYLDPIDAAVRSIMGPDSFDLHLSPTKAFSNIIQPHLTPPRSTSPPQNLPPTSPQSVVAPVNGISNTNKSLPDETTDVVPNLVSKAPQTETEKNTDESKVECPRDVAHHKLSNGHVTAAMDSSAEKSDNDLSPKAAAAEPVMGGIWNQDLFFLSKTEDQPPKKGCKIMKPKYPMTSHESQSAGLRSLQPVSSYVPSHAKPQPLINFDAKTISKKLGTGGWDVLLSENSDSDNEGTTPKVRIVERLVIDKRISMKDHDYCYDAYMTSQRPPTPPPAPIQVAPSEDLSEMDKIANNVAMGVAFDNNTSVDDGKKKQKKKKDKKKKKKKRHKKDRSARDSSSSDSEMDQDPPLIKLQPLAASTPAVPVRKGPKPKYHTSMTGRGVTAGAARPRFSDSSDEEVSSNNGLSDLELASSDLDTDFSADEKQPVPKRPAKPTAKAAALKEGDKPDTPKSSTIKLKIKLTTNSTLTSNVSNLDQSRKKSIRSSKKRRKSKLKSSTAKQRKTDHYGFSEFSSVTESKRKSFSTSESDSETESVFKENIGHNDGVDSEPNEKLYCVCQCPYDEVSEMIACDAPDCRLEWFHFECVGIMVAPEGQWYCPECTQRYGIKPRTCV